MPDTLDILVVDDDERLRVAAGKVLSGGGYHVECVGSAREAIQALRRRQAAVVLSDLRLQESDGIALLKQIRESWPEIEVVVLTGHGSVQNAVEAMKLGAYDFIEKPFDSDRLLKIAARALEKQRLASENRQLKRQLEQLRGLDALIGNNPRILAIKRLISQIAPTDINVLIQGESGTGKEVVADALHHLSERHDKRFVKISCAAIPETLLESELFGYERGAFTGAAATRPGRFELAHGGTLMLDEIAEMSPQLQAKLLRVLQDGKFQRLGGSREMNVDARLICATHADIPKAVEEGQFRQDLYYRINTLHVMLPPLRERADDIPVLAAHFLGLFAARMQRNVTAIAPAALQKLQAHSWPGNVRELEHVIQRAVALAHEKTVTDFEFSPHASGQRKPGPNAQNDGLSIPIGTPVDEATRKLVQATIEHCAGNKLQAAKLLGISPRTMYRHFSKPKE